MVNPVTEPVETFRNVYLPLGTNWINFWSGKKYSGGQTLPVPSPIDEIPLFVKEGSIIPMGPFIQYAAEAVDPVELRIYPGADGQFTLYEDEDDNYNYEKGAYSTIEFTWDDKNRQLIIEEGKGDFPNMVKSRNVHVVLVSEGKGGGVDFTQNADNIIHYNGERQTISFKQDN